MKSLNELSKRLSSLESCGSLPDLAKYGHYRDGEVLRSRVSGLREAC